MVRRSNDASLSLDVNISIEESVHFIVETAIKALTSIPTESDILTGVLPWLKETPGNAIGSLGLSLGALSRLPAASLAFALLLIDTHIAAISPEAFRDLTRLRTRQDDHSCKKQDQHLHTYKCRFIINWCSSPQISLQSIISQFSDPNFNVLLPEIWTWKRKKESFD